MKDYDVQKLIDSYNVNKKIRLILRPKDIGYMIYLYYNDHGKLTRISTKERVFGIDRKLDLEVIQKVDLDRNKKEFELLNNHEFYIKQSKMTLSEYAIELSKKLNHSDYHQMTIRLLIRYLKTDKRLADLTEKDIELFLINHPVSNTSKCDYLSSLKRVLNLAIKDGLINKNVTANIHIKHDTKKREYLTIEELKMIKDFGHTNHAFVKELVLFAAYTGLRRSDLLKLAWNDINEGVLNIVQYKTKDIVSMKLHPVCLDIISKLPRVNEFVFGCVPTYKYIRLGIIELIESSGIKKHISLHCFRHTFCTLLLSSDVPIYVASKLMGHKNIQTTLIYSNLIDSKKDEAIDKLPCLD